MGKTTIEWTSTRRPDGTYTPGYTHNLWWGCTKVAEGCKNCYAETWDRRSGESHWGSAAGRRFFKEAHYRQPLAWDRAAARAGERYRVFCMSMGDLFERHQQLDVNDQMIRRRCELWDTIAWTPNLDWLLLTKRLERVLDYVPDRWWRGWPHNVWLGFSASTQTEFLAGLAKAWDVADELAGIQPIIFVSLEPLIGNVRLSDVSSRRLSLLDWVIIGGESGSKARPMQPDWARRVRDDCVAAGIPFFFKQMGSVWGKEISMLDTKGKDLENIPVDLRIRQFPGVGAVP
jgi:protein gp37